MLVICNWGETSTYRAVGVGQLLRVVVVSVKGEGLFPEEGQNLGERSCVVLWENLAITVKTQQEVGGATKSHIYMSLEANVDKRLPFVL